jgi:hypothetical protein
LSLGPQNSGAGLAGFVADAIRYGVGVGRQGFGWSGVATIHDKQQWPDWYPPKEMIQRQPELMKVMSELQSGIGMHGGPRNRSAPAPCMHGAAHDQPGLSSTSTRERRAPTDPECYAPPRIPFAPPIAAALMGVFVLGCVNG